MRDQRVVRVNGDSLDTVAELSDLIVGDCNDMLVDPLGRAYVGNFGYDYAAGQPRAATSLVLVDDDGAARLVADDLWFPNGMSLSPDGNRLFVAETPAERISVFTVAPDGSLSDRHLLDHLDELRPDGISFDRAGRLWVASPGTGQLGCLSPDGTLLHVEDAPDGMVQTCVVGGGDGATLYVCATPTHDEAEALCRRSGRILARAVD